MQKLVAVLFVGFLCISKFSNGQLLVYPNKDTILTLNVNDLESQDNKVEIVQDYIVEVLKLPELRWRVRQAIGENGRIIFEMTSADDVEKILKQDVHDNKIVREQFLTLNQLY